MKEKGKDNLAIIIFEIMRSLNDDLELKFETYRPSFLGIKKDTNWLNL